MKVDERSIPAREGVLHDSGPQIAFAIDGSVDPRAIESRVVRLPCLRRQTAPERLRVERDAAPRSHVHHRLAAAGLVHEPVAVVAESPPSPDREQGHRVEEAHAQPAHDRMRTRGDGIQILLDGTSLSHPDELFPRQDVGRQARLRLGCDVRTLPGQDDTYLRQELEHLCEGHGVEIDIDYTSIPNASPDGTPFIELCRQSLALAIGNEDFKFVPAVTVGFTDSRFIRPLGAQVYGFNPHHPKADPKRSGVHGNNEYLEIDSLLLRTKNAVALACLTLGIK